jgi:hypothetical protein
VIATPRKYFGVVLILFLIAATIVLAALPRMFQNPVSFLLSILLLFGAAFVTMVATYRIWAFFSAAIRFRRSKHDDAENPPSS